MMFGYSYLINDFKMLNVLEEYFINLNYIMVIHTLEKVILELTQTRDYIYPTMEFDQLFMRS